MLNLNLLQFKGISHAVTATYCIITVKGTFVYENAATSDS